MINRSLRYLVMSDVHLGHHNNKTKTILGHLQEFFVDYAERLNSIQILFIAGDLFDTLLDLSSSDIQDIMIWMSHLMRYCSEKKIKLRILEGTRSHDWMQSSIFETVDRIADYKNIDYKYVPVLSIEIIQEYNLSILYVPDEWNDDTSITYNQVLALLRENNLSQVDIAMMHGQFAYQLPAAAIKAPKHSESQYLNIVKHYINIGHVHQFSTYERILAQGSFDRLCHGDEDPKGALLMHIKPEGDDEFVFLPNRLATIFKTIRLSEKHFEELFEYLDKQIEKYPTRSFIRIRSKYKELLNTHFDAIQKRYPLYTLTKDIESKDEQFQALVKTEINMTTYTPIVIRPENISDLLMKSVDLKYTLSVQQRQLCLQTIEESL